MIVLDLAHLKKDCKDASVYQQLFMDIWDRYYVYTDGSQNGNSVIYIFTHSYILKKDPPPQCERYQEYILTVRHMLVECNQERKDIFGRRDVVESFRFHPTLVLTFLKECQFCYKF